MKRLLPLLFAILICTGITAAQSIKVHVVSVRQAGNVTTVVAESATVRYQLRCVADPSNRFEDAQFCQSVDAGKDYEADRLPSQYRSTGMNGMIFESGVNKQTGLPTFYSGQHYEVVSERDLKPR